MPYFTVCHFPLDISRQIQALERELGFFLLERKNRKFTLTPAGEYFYKKSLVARINGIAPGIIVTPLAVDEFNGPRGDFYKNMFANCPAGRPGTADEVANVAEHLNVPLLHGFCRKATQY